jgi:hypothetical protein
MTTQRVNPFANLNELPVFQTRPKKDAPVASEAIDRISEEHGFLSRQAPKPKPPKRKPRRYLTGRNQQLNVKATSETIERFYKMAEDRRVPQGLLLEQALDALERAGASK